MAKSREEMPSKAGVNSTSKKLANSRHAFDEHPAARKIAGAFGKEGARGAADNSDEAPDTDSEPSEDDDR